MIPTCSARPTPSSRPPPSSSTRRAQRGSAAYYRRQVTQTLRNHLLSRSSAGHGSQTATDSTQAFHCRKGWDPFKPSKDTQCPVNATTACPCYGYRSTRDTDARSSGPQHLLEGQEGTSLHAVSSNLRSWLQTATIKTGQILRFYNDTQKL